MQSVPTPISRRLIAARVFALIALCMVPVSTALTNVFCALFAVAALSAPEFWRNLPSLVRQRASLAALLLLGALALSVSYTVMTPTSVAWEWVAKYNKLLLLPFAVLVFKDAHPSWATATRWSWFLTLCVILLLSTTNYLGLTHLGPAYHTELPLSRAWVFKNHIAAGMFGALLFYQAFDFALSTRSCRARLAFAAVGVLALLNVFVMLQGRTGQLIAVLLAFVVALRFILIQRRKAPLRAALAAGLLLAGVAALVVAACTMQGGRLTKVTTEIRDYQQHDAITSTGLRLEWYRKGFDLYVQRPVLGYGAGGLQYEFAKLAEGRTKAEGILTSNPHNEYLLMAVQLGAVGLLLFLNLLVQIFRTGCALDPRARQLLYAWLAIFAIGSLANSLLLDFAEGHLLVLLAGILLGCGHRAAPGYRVAPAV
jgi:O-antigen ligase